MASASISFGNANSGFQVGMNHGAVTFGVVSEENEAPPAPLSTVPFSRNADFIPDQGVFDELHEKLSVPGSRVALVGMGGVGKSQLAIEYCYQVRERSPEIWVFWICASIPARLEQSYRDLADTLKIPNRTEPDANIFELVHGWIYGLKQKWVLVVDDISDADLLNPSSITIQGCGINAEIDALRGFLWSSVPQSIYGAALITTRAFREVSSTDKYYTIPIGTMSEPFALALLKKLADYETEEDEAKELIRLLGYLPLAINIIAGHIKSRPRSRPISRILREFQDAKGERKPFSREDGSLIRRFQHTFEMALDDLERRSPASMELLFLMSFFDPEGFTENLLKRSPDEMDTNSDGRFADDVLVLKNLAFVKEVEGKFSLHRLIQGEVKIRLEESGQSERWRKQFIRNLSREFPTFELDSSSWDHARETCQFLFPHLKAAMLQPPNSDAESTLEWAELLQRGARYATMIGGTADMKQMAMMAMDVRERLLGRNDPQTMDSSMTVLRVHALEGKLDIAERLGDSLVSDSTRALGPEHFTSLAAMNYLALIKWHQGHWQEAEVLNLKVLEVRKRKLGPENLDTLTSLNNLALTYWNQGRWREAEQIQSQILETRSRLLGPKHPDTLTSMNNLATTYWNQGRWEDAEIIGKGVLDARIDFFGRQHPDTLTSMNNLASVYRDQGRLVDAEALSVEVLETYTKLLGRGHQNTLGSMENLASDYRNQGRWIEAEALQTQVLKARERILGQDHPDTFKSMSNLATTYRHQGRLEDAENLQVRALQTSQHILGRDHPDVLSRMSNLALTYQSQGKVNDAEEIFLQVLKSLQTQLGESHPDTLLCIQHLASVYIEKGRPDTAGSLLAEALIISERVLGKDHPSVLSHMNALASTYRIQGREDDAEEMLSRVMSARQRVLGPEHPATLVSMQDLAVIAIKKNQWKKAGVLGRTVKHTRIKIFGAKHPETLKAISLLDQIYQMNAAEEASDSEGSLSDVTDSESVTTSFSYAESTSTSTTLDHPIAMTGVEVFTASLLTHGNFQRLCKSALLERRMPRGWVHRNLGSLLRLLASHLDQEAQASKHANAIRFVRRASSRIASRILQTPGIVNIPGVEELSTKQLVVTSSRAKIEEYLKSRRNPAEPTCYPKRPMDYPAADNSDGFSRVEEDDLDADSDLSADELEVQPEIRIDEIERIEAFLFQTNAFQVMERSLFDFVYPSLRSILMKWISKKRRLKELTPKQLRNLEVAVSELQHIAPGRISVSLHDTPSVMNNIKGKWESFTAETWYWGPFKPYMRPLATGEARLHWRCVTCGKPRWAEVPLSFAKSVTGATKSLAQSNAPETISVQTSPDPQNFNASVLGQAGQDPDQNNVNKNLGHGPIHSRTDSNRRAEPEDDKLDLHVFLVMKHLSVFRSGYRLFQTQVKHMRDDDFFSWMRTTYYSQRGFFLAWFGISRYSHCEFFKFRRFGQSKYTPLIPEYPSTQQASYHYYPKPMDPLPPLSPHEFEDFFQGQAWHFTAARRLAQRFSRSGRDDTHENVIVNEILPKRDTILEEEDSSREVFWGLYVVENRSIPMLIFYSFVSMVPSIYFFFAWLFQWGHRGDLQNASVPLAVSLGFLGTFWGCIVLSSPSFQSPPNIH